MGKVYGVGFIAAMVLWWGMAQLMHYPAMFFINLGDMIQLGLVAFVVVILFIAPDGS